jgi:serine/threonine-protein kinase
VDDLDAVQGALTRPVSGPDAPPPAPPARRRPTARIALGLAALSVAAGGAAGALWFAGNESTRGTPAVTIGTVILSSHPEGASVAVDGVLRGTTPLVLQLPSGRRAVRVTRAGSEPASLVAELAPGAEWRRHVALAPIAEKPPAGTLRIETERPGAEVAIDGVRAGVTPLSLADLAPGEHVVQVRGASGLVTRRVTIEAGATSSLVLGSEAAPSLLSGWVSIATPFELQVYEDGRLLGVSRSERIMIGAGRHTLELVNETLGVQRTQTVVVEPGRTANVRFDPPVSSLTVNALPWAEVSIDGRPYGETPIANVSLPVGDHVVVLRHPTLGERQQTVTVRLEGPNRLSVDLRR